MSLWMIALIALAVLVFLTHPSFRYHRMHRWRRQPFAHRGLHDAARGIAENSLRAFEAARDAGYGMELDVQFSKDYQLVVFHDDDLSRMCGDGHKVRQLTLEELRALPLKGAADGAGMPTLQEVLRAVDGRAPLLIELKNGRSNRRLCQALMDALEDYPGEYIIESFNPLIVAWFRRYAPQVVRGQLVGPMQDYVAQVNQIGAFCMAGLLFNFIARPDFVAYDANAPRFFTPHFQRFMFHTPMAAWTVKTPELADLIEKRHEIAIFEGDGRK